MLGTVLIAITIISGSAPGAMVNTTSFPNQSMCSSVLQTASKGVASAYKTNAMGVNRDTKTEVEDGWTVVSTGMGRELGRFKCE